MTEEMEAETSGKPEKETPPVPVGPKRVLVNPRGDHIQDAKRFKAEPDTKGKMNCILFLCHTHESILFSCKVQRNNVDLVAQVTALIETLHNATRQQTNKVGSLNATLARVETVVINKIIFKYTDCLKMYKAIALLYGYTYGADEASKSKTGMVSSFLGNAAAWKGRLATLRLSNLKIPRTRNAEEVQEIPISQFGLTSAHAGLLEGCLLSPAIASTMKQSLGPMTVVINLCMATEEKYAKNWSSTFCSTFRFLPNASEIAKLLAGSESRHHEIVRRLADLASFGTTRQSNKALMPYSLILVAMMKNDVYKASFLEKCPGIKLLENCIPGSVKGIDFSGRGLYAFWNSLKDDAFTLKGGVTMTPDLASQALLHSVFGTYREDLSLLEWQTGVAFNTRRDFGDAFKCKATEGSDKAAKPIPFIYVSKLASAAQTRFFSGGNGQMTRQPVFSGKCFVRVSLDDELLELVKVKEDSGKGRPLGQVEDIAGYLDRAKTVIADRVSKELRIDYGTTSWFLAPIVGGKYGDELEIRPELKGRFFFGNN